MTDHKIIEDFVRNSNWIEQEFEEEGPIWENHLDIAYKIEEESVKRQKILHPSHIHAALMKNIVDMPGEYRNMQVYIGNRRDPQPAGPAIVNIAMNNWFDCLKTDIDHIHKNKEHAIFNVEDVAWQYHYWFEAIHPFIDGNGRTGRLILNNIRRSFGFSWMIVKGTPQDQNELIQEHREYYEAIRKWRKENSDLLSIKNFS